MEKQTQELIEYIKQAVEFGKEQAPLVAQEMLRYGWWESLAWTCLTAACFVFLAILFIRFFRIYRICASKNSYNSFDWDFFGPFMVAGLGIGVVLSAVFCAMNCLTLIQIQIAPRVYLLGQIKHML
jgi:hypothetical protein